MLIIVLYQDTKQVNMEVVNVKCGETQMPIYRNTKAISAGDEILLYKPIAPNVPTTFKRKAEAEAEKAAEKAAAKKRPGKGAGKSK